MSALQDCKHCGFKWPKLDNAGRCAMCIARSGQPTERDERMRAEGATAERARIVAIAREMAVEYDKATGEGLDNAANALKWARGAAARDALLALVGRIDP